MALKALLQCQRCVYSPDCHRRTVLWRVEENRYAVTAFAANWVVLMVDTDTADVFGQVKQQLRAKGRPIPENDLWIAALAIQYDLALITDDEHFSAVDNLSWRWW